MNEFDGHGTMSQEKRVEDMQMNIFELAELNLKDINDENGKFNKEEIKNTYIEYLLAGPLQRTTHTLEKSHNIKINVDENGEIKIKKVNEDGKCTKEDADTKTINEIKSFLKKYFESTNTTDIEQSKKS